jgi:hypothetical protein
MYDWERYLELLVALRPFLVMPRSEVSGESPRLKPDRTDISEEVFDLFEEFSEYPGGNIMLSTYTRMCHYYDLDGLFAGWEDPHDSDFGGTRLYHPLETIFFRRYRGQMNIMYYTSDGMKFMDANASTPLDCWRLMWRAQYEFKDDIWYEYRHRCFRKCMREIRLRWAMDVVRELAYRPGGIMYRRAKQRFEDMR